MPPCIWNWAVTVQSLRYSLVVQPKQGRSLDKEWDDKAAFKPIYNEKLDFSSNYPNVKGYAGKEPLLLFVYLFVFFLEASIIMATKVRERAGRKDKSQVHNSSISSIL